MDIIYYCTKSFHIRYSRLRTMKMSLFSRCPSASRSAHCPSTFPLYVFHPYTLYLLVHASPRVDFHNYYSSRYWSRLLYITILAAWMARILLSYLTRLYTSYLRSAKSPTKPVHDTGLPVALIFRLNAKPVVMLTGLLNWSSVHNSRFALRVCIHRK